MNPVIGHITCPITGEHCEVARAKSGKFPYYYRGANSGIIHGKAAGFQRWLLKQATFTTPQANPYEPLRPAHDTTEEMPTKEPTAKTGSWLDDLMGEA